eukprot:CAMPEP_0198112794 /NCGR_PEP_ID=MMETSP1442-20131203/4590_1 /TAXON_ID= /ORGANISM="Craspedostauros australis, Strain CCMP3328" /LENGTH=127 /DNA_ID=CAMNT_0043769701 /DNA_START=906 /DNA_END=1289 /DNA_ORIENTATION=+
MGQWPGRDVVQKSSSMGPVFQQIAQTLRRRDQTRRPPLARHVGARGVRQSLWLKLVSVWSMVLGIVVDAVVVIMLIRRIVVAVGGRCNAWQHSGGMEVMDRDSLQDVLHAAVGGLELVDGAFHGLDE